MSVALSVFLRLFCAFFSAVTMRRLENWVEGGRKIGYHKRGERNKENDWVIIKEYIHSINKKE